MTSPKWRKPLGILLIFLFICGYGLAAGLFLARFTSAPVLLQLLFYAVAGIAWIWAVRPLMVWTETGRWRWRRD